MKTKPIRYLRGIGYPTLFLALLLALGGCSLLPGKHIYTEIDIPAKPRIVWRILTDIEKYPEWNPYHVRVEGKLETGQKLYVEIHKPNGEKVEIEPHVMRVIPQKELTWGGGIKGIFFGEHVFLLKETPRGITKLVQKEDFIGIGVPFASLEAIEEGYNNMNIALKQRAEAMERK